METDSNPFIRFLLDKQKELKETDEQIQALTEHKAKLIKEFEEVKVTIDKIIM